MTRFLLDLGSDPRHCLFAAVWNDGADILRMLIDAGAVLDVRADGVTPLLYAARLGRVATLRVLLDAGADLRATDRKGNTPYRLARRSGVPPDLLARLQA